MTDIDTDTPAEKLYKQYIAKLEEEARGYQARISILEQERARLTQNAVTDAKQIAALQGQITALNNDILRLQRELGIAEAEIELMKATWTPPVAKQADMWIGATINAKTGQTYAQAFAAWELTKGRIGVLRTFNPGLPAIFSSSNGSTQMRGRHRIISVKGEATAAYWDRYIASIPAEFTPTGEVVITAIGIHHEPENDGGNMTPARYKAACKLLDEAILRSGRKDIIAAVILMTWLEDDKDDGTSSGDWMPDNAHRFVLLMDPYDPNNTRTLWSKIEPTLALWRMKGGEFWGVAETGSHRLGADLAKWIREGFIKCSLEGALFWCWFHSGVGKQAGPQGWWLDDPTGSAEYKKFAPVLRAAA